jgi:phosphoribosyl-dephospho-CoA transferase
MFHCEPHSVRTHDLLEIDANQLIAAQAAAPQWVEGSLRRSPFVVVRRGRLTEQEIPVGIRGAERNQRWATFCHPKFVKTILSPPQLLRRTAPISRANVIRAFRALNVLKNRWTDLDLPWGPTGSVGFELATGNLVANERSDLDIVIYADTRMTVNEAESLCAHTMELSAVADIRVETPVCGFSLTEYARAGFTGILLRTPEGHVLLGHDPWDEELKTRDAGQSVVKEFSAR